MKKILLFIPALIMSVCSLVKAQLPVIIKDINPGSLDGSTSIEHLKVGSIIFFSGNDGTTGNELWVTDGTAAGTMLVKDITPGSKGSIIVMLGVYQGKLIFAADDSTHGREPWISDGTAAGTFMLADINPGTASSLPTEVKECLGKLYFQADDGIHGQEPWVSDGTVAGTVLLEDVQPGFNGSGPRYFIEYNGVVYFQTYTNTYGYEPWITTGNGAAIFKDLQPGFADGGFEAPFVFNNKLYFESYTPAEGTELWVTDGQPNNTALFIDLNPGSGNGIISSTKDTINNKMVFTASDGIHGYELWATDGTTSGTAMIKDIEQTGPGSYPRNFIKLRNQLYFITYEGNFSVKNLWKTDLTTAGTEKVSLFDPAIANSVMYPTVWKDSIYFVDYSTFNGSNYLRDLFVTAGDSASVRKINRLSMQDALNASWLDVTNNGIVYRAKYDVTTGYELYTLDYPATTKLMSVIKDDFITIYPNPATNLLVCKNEYRFQQAIVSIKDLLGKEVIRMKNVSGSELSIDIHTLPAGAYFLQINDGRKQFFEKVLKQ